MKLFTKGESNSKLAKGMGGKYSTLILHLAPAKESGHEVCSSRSAGCTAACLFTAGRGRMNTVKKARINRTKWWFEDRDGFKKQIIKELEAFQKHCDKKDLIPSVRMNGTSDIIWESVWPELFTKFKNVTFYDFTKHTKRCLKSWSNPDNYHLTFSRSESNEADCIKVLKDGLWNVVAVFNNQFPAKYKGFPTFNADLDDLRFLDPKGGHIGCLKAKGDAKKDKTGFIIRT